MCEIFATAAKQMITNLLFHCFLSHGNKSETQIISLNDKNNGARKTVKTYTGIHVDRKSGELNDIVKS